MGKIKNGTYFIESAIPRGIYYKSKRGLVSRICFCETAQIAEKIKDRLNMQDIFNNAQVGSNLTKKPTN